MLPEQVGVAHVDLQHIHAFVPEHVPHHEHTLVRKPARKERAPKSAGFSPSRQWCRRKVQCDPIRFATLTFYSERPRHLPKAPRDDAIRVLFGRRQAPTARDTPAITGGRYARS